MLRAVIYARAYTARAHMSNSIGAAFEQLTVEEITNIKAHTKYLL